MSNLTSLTRNYYLVYFGKDFKVLWALLALIALPELVDCRPPVIIVLFIHIVNLRLTQNIVHNLAIALNNHSSSVTAGELGCFGSDITGKTAVIAGNLALIVRRLTVETRSGVLRQGGTFF